MRGDPLPTLRAGGHFADIPASIRDGKLTFGEWVANGDFSIVDLLKAKTGSEATLFQAIDGKLIRIATTVMKAAAQAAVSAPN
jgi:hypothetical protein